MEEKRREFKRLKLQRKKEEVNRDVAQNAMDDLSAKILEIEYPFMEWDGLDTWIRENRSGGKVSDNNPIVRSSNGFKWSQCFINKDGELQIGGYYHHDHFKRGEKLRVHFEFKAWSTCYG